MSLCTLRSQCYQKYKDDLKIGYLVSGSFYNMSPKLATFSIANGLDGPNGLNSTLKEIGIKAEFRRSNVMKINVYTACKLVGISVDEFSRLYSTGEHAAVIICSLCRLESVDGIKKHLDKNFGDLHSRNDVFSDRLDRIEQSVDRIGKRQERSEDAFANAISQFTQMTQQLSLGSGSSPVPQPRKKKPLALPAPSSSPKSKKKPCRFFAKNGHCKFGDKCRFSHDSASNASSSRSSSPDRFDKELQALKAKYGMA